MPTWTSNIPSQVKPYANLGAFPQTGSVKTIYIAEDTDIAYYWTGSAYQAISIQDLSGLVPYMGATNDVDLGNNDLNAEGIKIKGTAGNGHLNMKHQSSNPSAGGQETVIFAGSDGEPRFKNDGNAVEQFASRQWVGLQGFQNTPIVVNANITAQNDRVYHVVANATFTDPTPVEGRGYVVFVRNGTATIGGNPFSTAGNFIYRLFHSGAWALYPFGNINSLSTIFNAAYVPQSRTINGLDLSTNRTLTTANINDSTNRRYVTDAQLTVIGNTSGTNTGDETQASILSKLGFYRYLNVTPSTVHTGTTIETQIEMITIPANTFKNTSDVFDFLIQARRPSGSGSGAFTFRFRLGTTNVMSSATILALSIPGSTAVYAPLVRSGSINSGTLLIFSRASNLTNDLTATGVSPATTTSLSFDFTTTLYAFVSIELSNSSDSVQITRVQLKNF